MLQRRFSPPLRPLCGLLFAMLALPLSSSLRAQGGGPQRLVLQVLDTDHDGTLSAAEIGAAPAHLLTLDRNGDGQIAADELQSRPENAGASPDQLVTQLMQFDKDGDGALTAEELPARLQPMLARGDANHDGRLTPEEIRAMARRQSMPAGAASSHPEGSRRNDPLVDALDTDHDGTISAAEIAAASHALLALDKNGDGTIAADEMAVRQPSPEQRVSHLMDEWDTNKDGRLSKAEAPDRMQAQFASIDKNGDGFLDKEELLAYFQSPAGQGGGPRRGGQGEPNRVAPGTAPQGTPAPQEHN